MSGSGSSRPRRAFGQDTDSETPIGDDDTPVTPTRAARRGADPEADETTGTSEATPAEPGTHTSTSRTVNPFARPGSTASADEAPAGNSLVPAPISAVPAPDSASQDSGGWRTSTDSGNPSPKPRRSAVSSTTPPEQEWTDTGAEAPESDSWVTHHRRTLLIWIIGALVVALMVVLGTFLATRKTSTDPSSSPSQSASPSPSVSAVPAVSVDDLVTLEDAEAVLAGATWTITTTAETKEEATLKPACLGADVADVNPTDTFQRTIGTSDENLLAVFHQVDLYATAEAAQAVQSDRATNLAQCDERQALILGSSVVTGLGDETAQLTVAYQDEPLVLHTVVLVRTGRALTMFDATQSLEGVPVESVIAGLRRSLDAMCSRVDGTCPTEPTVAATVPPPVDPIGWLIPADLPRIRPGYGQWVAKDPLPSELTATGMGCENLPLATEPGPTQRQQRTYLITQDDTTPGSFGLDEMVFTFPDNATAVAFSDKLTTALLTCTERNNTAKVTDLGTIEGTGAAEIPVTGRIISIDQSISDTEVVQYQLAVNVADARVSYLLATVTSDYSFSLEQQQSVALRSAQRLSQG